MTFDSQKRTERAQNGGSCGYKNGWYVLDLKGTSNQIGYDHGVMLAEEIRDYVEESRQYVWVCRGLTTCMPVTTSSGSRTANYPLRWSRK
jgi:hypothetical protein